MTTTEVIDMDDEDEPMVCTNCGAQFDTEEEKQDHTCSA